MTIGFIGAGGNIATAIISGIIGSGFENEQSLRLFDTDISKLEKYKNAVICENATETVKDCDYIFLTVKPQVIFSVLDGLKGKISSNQCIVSVAAGISIQSIKNALETDAKVIRVMPNTPLLLSEGASGVSMKPPVSRSEFLYVLDIFKTAGVAVECEEEQINAVTAVSGSSPAYVFRFAKAIISEAKKLGLDEKIAETLTYQTLTGAAEMLKNSGMSADELIKMVTSPKGTTLAALESFDKNSFDTTVANAVRACYDRAVELGKSE